MEEVNQAVQASGAAGAAYSGAKSIPFIGKIIAIFGGGAAIASWFVMTFTKMGSDDEFRKALASTFIVAIFGGAGVIRYFDLGVWVNDFFGCVALCGIIILCGVPGWIFVKAIFLTADKLRGKDIGEIISTIKGWFK